MDKAFEKFIEGLPRPVIFGTVVIIGLAWVLKEYKAYSSYGDVFKDLAFQVTSAVILLSILAYYTSVVIRSRKTPRFDTGVRGVLVARINGDSEDRVQAHTVESTKLVINRDRALSDVRVKKISRTINDHSQACSLANDGLAKLCVWGMLIPPKIVHFTLSEPVENLEARAMITDFEQEISVITDEIVAFLNNSPPSANAPQERIEFFEKQLAQQESINERNARIIDGLNEKIRELKRSLETSQTRSLVDSIKKQELKRRRKILSTGISRYQAFPSLSFPDKDATVMNDFVRKCWQESAEGTLLTNADATRQTVLMALDQFSSSVQESDQVWFYFSGHVVMEGGNAYFVLHDTDPEHIPATAISMEYISHWVNQLPAKQFVGFVDSCYSGAFTQVMTKGTSSPSDVFSNASGRVIIAAGGAYELALEDPSLEQGVFTHFLLKGLSGLADKNLDGIVTEAEIFEYLHHSVSEASKAAGFRQSPVMWAADMTGSFVLSIVDQTSSH